MHYRKTWLLVGFSYATFIILASLIKVPAIEVPINHMDKIIHFLMYFILVAWFGQLYQSHKKHGFILLLAIALGCLLEIAQGMTSYRSFDTTDMLANSIGAISAFLLLSTLFNQLLSNIDHFIYQKMSSIL